MQPARGSVLLCSACIERAAVPEHGLFDPFGNHRANISQVFANPLNLFYCLHQKLQVGIEPAHGPVTMLVVKVGAADKVVDIDYAGALAMPVDASIALLQAIGIPGNLVM